MTNIKDMGLEDVVKEMDKVMKDARLMVDRDEYTGVVRNLTLKVFVGYLNELQHQYKFQDRYDVVYKNLCLDGYKK